MIDAAKQCKVDAVKIQLHNPNWESTEKEDWPERFRYHPQDTTRQEYWQRMSLDGMALHEIDVWCKARDLKLIISPFSLAAVEASRGLSSLWAYKIASGEVDNLAMIDRLCCFDKPIIMSTGMSDTREVNATATYIMQRLNQDLYVLQCTTEYPTPWTRIGMNVVDAYSRNILWKGGLSDHSGCIYPSIIAAYLGAHLIEVHCCFSKKQFGADITASLTFDELAQMVDGVRCANLMRRNPVNKDLYEPDEDTKVYRQGKVRMEFNPWKEE
jgi:N-acetylneuraminate synthase